MLGSEDLMEDSQRLYMHVGLRLSLKSTGTSFRLFRATVRRMLVLSTYLYDVTLEISSTDSESLNGRQTGNSYEQ